MSKIVCILVTWIVTLICLAASLTGCSGGGGKSAKSGELVDPSSSYKGATTKSVPTETNAEDLAMGGFGGTKIATSIHNVAKTSDSSVANATGNLLVFSFAQLLKQSVRRMELPPKAALLRKQSPATSMAKSVGRTNIFQLQGDSGGTASYSMEINDTTGSFFGTIVFQSFTSNGIIVDGTTEMLGTFDANQQQFSRLTLSFSSLAFRTDNSTLSLTGSLSWGFNFTSSTEALSMNLVLLDQASAKTYWFNNYELITVYSGSSLTQTISGRYYDHDHGYIDLTTQTPLVATYGYQWPSQGSLAFKGNLGRWVRLSFLAKVLKIEVDTNGDDTADWQVERQINVHPLINMPPTADAGPDQNVSQWATVQLDGSTSSDPNGDSLTYSWNVTSSPDYIYAALINANTATPSFIADRPGTYVLSLSVYDGNFFSQQDTVTVVVTPTVPSDPTFVEKQWQFGTYGYSIGQAGLFTTDLDGDGAMDIIASSSVDAYAKNVLWYVLRKDKSGDYEQVWHSPNYGVTIVRILLADMSGDGKDDVVVALADGTIRIYDGPTLQESRTIMVAAQLADLAIADLDYDGTKEIVTSDGIGVSVYNADSGTPKWSTNTGGGNSIAVGNVDADTAMEIVTTSYGGKGYVLNGFTGAIKWEYINSFGAKVRLTDLDSDGMQEIVGASSWGKITVFKADLKSPAWEIQTDHDISAIVVSDADGDGMPEIIYGDGQWGKTHFIDVSSHAEKWAVNNPEYIVSGIVLGDINLDGKNELLWGTAGTTLFIADPQTNIIKWKNISRYGLQAVAVGDIDNDGVDEIVMASNYSNNENDEGSIHIFNTRTHALKFQQNLGFKDFDLNSRVVRIGDVDGDGRTEFVVTTANYYTGVIRVYDGATYTLKRETAIQNNNYFTTFAIGDLNNDGMAEIVAAQSDTGQSVHLVVLDGATMQEKWRSVDLGFNWKSIHDINLADLDKDGHSDIIVSLTDSRLIVFDGVNHNLKLMVESPVRSTEVVDVDGDGFLEILVGRNDGKIDVHDGVTFAIKQTVSTFGTTSVDALRVTDLDGDGIKEWLIASGGVLSIQDKQKLKWRSSFLGSNLGKNNSIAVKDIEGGGRQKIFIGSDSILYQFK